MLAGRTVSLPRGQADGAAVARVAERLDRLPFGLFHVMLIASVFAGLAFDHMDQVVLSFASAPRA